MSTFGSVPPESDIVDELTSGRYNMFQVLVEAVTEAKLVDTLRRMKNYTVLCPTNLAFQRAGMCFDDGHLKFKSPMLQDVLKSHIIPRRLTHIPASGTLSTLNGEVRFDTEYDEAHKYPIRTTATLLGREEGEDVSACVLVQMFESSNANFAAIGRVLVAPTHLKFGPPHTVHFHDGHNVHFSS
jgi:Fasciclin domain